MDDHWPTSSSTQICLRTCPVRTLKLECPPLAAGRMRSRAIRTTRLALCLLVSGSMCLTTTQYKSLPYVSTKVQRLEVERLNGHQLIRGCGGVIAVLYEPHWRGLLRPPWWEREMNLQHSRQHILSSLLDRYARPTSAKQPPETSYAQ